MLCLDAFQSILNLRMYIQLMVSLLQAHVVTIYYNLLLLCLGLIFCLCLLYIYHMSYTMKFNSQKCGNFFLLNFHFISNTSDAIFSSEFQFACLVNYHMCFK